jgi:4-hydroxybenzoate polyprenyltransferase
LIRFKSFLHFLINSNIYVSLAAVALAEETFVMVGAPLNAGAVLLLIFFSTLFIYTVSRIQLKSGRSFSESFQTFPNKSIAFLSCGGALLTLSEVSISIVLLMVPLGLISIGYALPLFRRKTHAFRLREVPMLKIFIISLVWAVTTVIIPLLDQKLPILNMEVFLIWLRRMLYIFAITVPFDIRDQAEDARNKLKTLPGAFGVKGAKIIAATALVFFMVLLFIKPCEQQHFSMVNGFEIPLMVSAFIAAVFIYKTNDSRNKYYYLFLLDGTMIFQFFLVLCWRVYFFK